MLISFNINDHVSFDAPVRAGLKSTFGKSFIGS